MHPRTLVTIRVLFCGTVALLIASASISFRRSQSTVDPSRASNPSALTGKQTPDRSSAGTSKTKVVSVAETLSPKSLAKFQQARDLARESRFQAAIQVLEDYKAVNPNEVVAIIQAQQQWANEILKRAKDQYLQGNLKEAQRLAHEIPTDAVAHQTYMQQKKLWEQNSQLVQKAIQLSQQTRSKEAIALLDQVNDSDLKSSPYLEKLRHQITLQIEQAGKG